MPLHVSDIYMSIFRSAYMLNTNGQTVRKVTHQLRRTTASIPMA